ncbi:DUF4153 domain-containing protein [Methylotenera sp.]|uniref:DUF4153 domain-containing protein n=1 Tax=Methylotenera sp. TaxID=2051956 RepID=UPI0024871C1D|nr:DUF4153 domain-containing protein [Methylotenera sp.]MDI1297757.1 DUF4153 domain-containing protein [Methylotenera sp.]
MEVKQQKQEKKFILVVALAQGLMLLLMHNWVKSLVELGASYQLILPLYALIVTLPLSLMMLANQPRQLLIRLALSFSLVATFCAAYIGHVSYAKGMSDYAFSGIYWILGICIFVAWFIALAFFEHFCQYKQWFNRYEALFNFSWRNAVKVIVASIFVSLFWGALELFVALFKILGIPFFDEIFNTRYFIYPATTVAFGLGLSLYAAREEALSEFKRAILQVLGWLLPLVSLILLTFIITLPFKGLGTLWGTGYAAGLMLGLLGLTVFLLNTAFQDGRQISYPAWLLKLTNIGLLTMPVYALLCIYAVYLRVHQYGWTSDRVWAASLVAIMAIYSFGYAFAAIKSFNVQQSWMQLTKTINVYAALAVVAVLILINSPVLNPTRIGVHSQVARLLEGKVKADNFDFQYLRFKGGQYGNDALHDMVANQQHPELKVEAQAALDASDQSYYSKPEKRVGNIAVLKSKINVYPKGTVLEEGFYEALLADKNAGTLYWECLSSMSQLEDVCRVLAVDLNDDYMSEVILLNPYGNRVYSKEATGWKYIGDTRVTDYAQGSKKSDLALLESGDYKVLKPEWHLLRFGNETLSIEKR